MRAYSSDFIRTSAGGQFTGFGLTSTAAIRPEIFFIQIGSAGTVADVAHQFVAKRTTANGTRTAFTPVALDPGDPASTATAGHTHTGEPTYTASSHLLRIAMHQRATYQWWAMAGSALKCPATAANGIGIEAQDGAGTPTITPVTYTGVVHFRE